MGTTDVRLSWTHQSMNYTSTGSTNGSAGSGRQQYIQISQMHLRTVNGTTEVWTWSTNHQGHRKTHCR